MRHIIRRKGDFGMYLSGQWYHLTAKADLTKDDPVEGLDVAYLQREFLQPYLDIQDPKTSKRIRYVGGIRGLFRAGAYGRSCKKRRSRKMRWLFPCIRLPWQNCLP